MKQNHTNSAKTQKQFVIVLLLIVNCALIIPGTRDSFGQSITWQREFPEYYGEVSRVQQTYDGGYIAVGEIRISNTFKMRLIKCNMFGDTLWSKIIGVGSTSGYWVEETNDRGLIIGGSTDSGIGNPKVLLVKTDSIGNIEWQKTFSNSDLDQCHCVKQTPDGGYILSCRTALLGSNNALFIKTDQNGNLLWNKTFGSLSNQIVVTELQILQDGYITAGRIGSLAAADAYVMRLDLNGDTLWTKRFGGNDFDLFRSIAIVSAPLNGFILGGTSRSFSANGNYFSLVVKIDNNGNQEWEKTYSSNQGYDQCVSIIYYPSIGYLFAGASDSLNNFAPRAKIRKIDFSGNVLFESSFLSGEYASIFNSAGLTNDGGFIFGGCGDNNFPYFYIVKTDSLGFANPIGIVNQQFNSPTDYVLYQNYPNPFNPVTDIKFDITKSTNVKLTVVNLLGQEVEILVNQNLVAGSYTADWNASNFPSGVYFYKLVAGEFVDVKKMVLLK